jgi:hypothetical protein
MCKEIFLTSLTWKIQINVKKITEKNRGTLFEGHLNTENIFFQQKGIEIWARPILPVFKGKYSYGIVFLNRRTDGTPSEVNIFF